MTQTVFPLVMLFLARMIAQVNKFLIEYNKQPTENFWGQQTFRYDKREVQKRSKCLASWSNYETCQIKKHTHTHNVPLIATQLYRHRSHACGYTAPKKPLDQGNLTHCKTTNFWSQNWSLTVMLEYVYTPEYRPFHALLTQVKLNHNAQDRSRKGVKLF
jgi:hypothetical protein